MKNRSFEQSIDELGTIGERIIARQYRLNLIGYNEDPEAQRQGNDGGRGFLAHQIKTRGPDTPAYWNGGPDLLIETVSVVEQKIPGWIYTSKADILFYGVLNMKFDDFVYLWRFKFDKLREWWAKQDADKYEPKIADTRDRHTREVRYHTENRVVPLKDIPRHFYTDERSETEQKSTARLMRNPVKAYNEVSREWQHEQRGKAK